MHPISQSVVNFELAWCLFLVSFTAGNEKVKHRLLLKNKSSQSTHGSNAEALGRLISRKMSHLSFGGRVVFSRVLTM